MKIIDTHSHLWLKQDTSWNGLPIRSLKNGRSIFLGEEVQMIPPFIINGENSAEVFLSNMDYAQVSAAVVVQELIDGCQNDYLLEVSRKYPDRFITCGMCDCFAPSPASQTGKLIEMGFKGIAIPGHRLITDQGRVMLNSPEMMELFKLMEEKDVFLSLTLADGDIQTAEMQEVIDECPDLRIAIGHFGMPTREKWQEQIKLARNRNVFIESGGITWLYNSEFYPFDGAVKAIREASDLVGMEKLMWGSDYPRTITAITYRMSYDFILKSKEMTEKEKELFLGENAIGFYRLENLVDLPYIKNMSE
ncbi:MAG: amidohydrolase [Bacteroidales bacterium]|nr:amidohydrolase [Bacteroidales bacterium]